MSEIAKWLEAIGLGEHAGLFAENDLDVDLLAELTDDDLKELGLSLGHRKRVLRAVSEHQDSDQPLDATPEVSATGFAGERRQVTVLFADLAGFTQLSGSLDAEEVHGLLNRYFAVVDGVIKQHGGHVGASTHRRRRQDVPHPSVTDPRTRRRERHDRALHAAQRSPWEA